MTVTLLTSASKEALRKTVRGLRTQLIRELTEAAEGEYRLGVEPEKAKLPEARASRRQRLEDWLAERARSTGKPATKTELTKLRARHLGEAAEEAAHTFLNRLVLVRILEHHRVLEPSILTGYPKSPGYTQEFLGYAGPLATDDTRGFAALLDVVFGELALDLPGLFGPVGLTQLFPVPAATLRDVATALNDPELDAAWGDDTTLGWVYQYWNDPEREALDKKIAEGGKIEPHEIASKTQMFTERYMVEWLLHNSLGITWLCICKKNGWTPDADRVLGALDARRAAFRKQREVGEVALDALMPINDELESAWKYFVPQPIPQDAVENAPASIRDLKLLDPACGSGHFLVIAFDLLVRMHEEEARHRGESWTREAIAETILGQNLFGIDIDARAIQIAAAALWLKARLYAPNAKLTTVNLVAPALRLGRLPKDDPALERLRAELEREVGVPRQLTTQLVESLAGVDHLGSLLRVDEAITAAVATAETSDPKKDGPQGNLFTGFAGEQLGLRLEKAKITVRERLERFLAEHSASEDLGVRLDGEQLEAGVRFVRIAREAAYDVVVGNPPYQGLSKTTNFTYVVKNYPRGKADLYAAFLERGLELVREGGVSALVTMRGWMFLNQFKELRSYLLHTHDLTTLVDLDSGAFEEVSAAQVVLSVDCAVFRRSAPNATATAIRPTPTEDRASTGMVDRKRAGLLAQVGRHAFDPKGFAVIDGEPIVYWWTKDFLDRYANAPKLGSRYPALNGLSTQNNVRFVRAPWEVDRKSTWLCRTPVGEIDRGRRWYPYIKGGEGAEWFEPLSWVVPWFAHGTALRVFLEEYQRDKPGGFVKHSEHYFKLGVAFAVIGAAFSARAHRFRSIFGHMGSSLFPEAPEPLTCMMNSKTSRFVLESFNPGVHFLAGDVNRLPLLPPRNAEETFHAVERAFSAHESHRESSSEFQRPGASPWRHAQEWAQRAIDRAERAALPSYEPELDPPDPEAHLSFAIGVALGRFGADGEGIRDNVGPEDALPDGILFVGPGEPIRDSFQHMASTPVEAAWDHFAVTLPSEKRPTMRDWLRKDFFAYHKGLYENRPIHFPLSSEKKTFVAWVSIHRFTDQTLPKILADHVNPVLRDLDAQIADLNVTRASSDKKAQIAAEKAYTTAKRMRDELADFGKLIAECAERGAPPTDPACPKRDADATFHMDLDDGVMINSAALWPLLAPQWSDPKKWWKQLCEAKGKKDYDWAHLARRYFPQRVEEKCKTDPSLAVAHGCFWKYHPAKAFAWELRLQHEIGPEFMIEEPEAVPSRIRFIADHKPEADAIYQKELTRRERAAKKAEDSDGDVTEADDASEEQDDT